MTRLNFKELYVFIKSLNINQYYSTDFTYNFKYIRVYISTYEDNPFFVLLININNITISKDITFLINEDEDYEFVNINKFWSPEDYKNVKELPKKNDMYSFDPFYKYMMNHVMHANFTIPSTYQIKNEFSNLNTDSKYFFCLARGGMQEKQYIKSCSIIGKRNTDLLRKRNLGIRFTPHIFKKKEFSIDLYDH